jgi:hypothetical protein
MNINNKDVIQSYIMTTAKYDFSADEKRILLRLVETWQYLLEGKELKGKIDRDLFGGYILEFPISYFVPDNQTNYKRIKDALRSLNDKKFEYEDSNLWEIIRIIERPQIRKREKVIFELNEKIVECFLNFTKGYRKFELETALSFSSVYAVRFYELMSGQTTPLTFTFTKLKEMFQLTDKYPRTPDFIKRVIEPAKRELDEKSPFSFEYRYKEPDMKEYIRTEVIPKYAEGFNKGLKADDLEFYGKIHFERHEKDGEDLHAHIIVSHKTKNNGKSISPMTNHTGKKNTGAAQGGFNRKEWYSSCERAFDKRFKNERDIKESFEYKNAMKNGTPKEMQEQINRAIQQERQREQQVRQQQEQRVTQAVKTEKRDNKVKPKL